MTFIDVEIYESFAVLIDSFAPKFPITHLAKRERERKKNQSLNPFNVHVGLIEYIYILNISHPSM